MPASSCATEILCCNSVTYVRPHSLLPGTADQVRIAQASDPSTAQLLALLGINIAGSYHVGVSCTPIAFVGAGSGSCSAQPVCCWWGAQYVRVILIPALDGRSVRTDI